MFNRLKDLYEAGRLTKAGLARAVTLKKWLSAADYEKIVGEPLPDA